jgi:CheY-like chemotaxis protein
VQGAQGPERASGGLGVGLALVKNLVSLHGGSVAAASAGRGHGSTFTVTLPLAVDDPDAMTVPAPLVERSSAAAASQRILVIDDNADAAEAMADYLGLVGFEVCFSTDADEGLALVAAFAPDVAVLDIGLPKVDGYALAAKIRAATDGRCRLIAVTGYGLAEDRARTKAAGFEAHFVKPVDLERLVDALHAR